MLEGGREVRRRVTLPPEDDLDPITQDEISKQSKTSSPCSQQALRLVEYISEGFKVKRKTVAVFFDVAKAFDRIWHARLIHKLYQLELPDRLVLIIHHYISNRHFSFRLDNTYSSMRPIRAGVPQGSTLSPLLYSAYINDIPRPSSGVQLALFADDTAPYLSSELSFEVSGRCDRLPDLHPVTLIVISLTRINCDLYLTPRKGVEYQNCDLRVVSPVLALTITAEVPRSKPRGIILLCVSSALVLIYSLATCRRSVPHALRVPASRCSLRRAASSLPGAPSASRHNTVYRFNRRVLLVLPDQCMYSVTMLCGREKSRSSRISRLRDAIRVPLRVDGAPAKPLAFVNG
ncbi:Probable RNA-directed DNA polymerase from transposon BS [Eumeta japonica]|uniref:Probable RNA-directed DNA polymerase from transposon BS n=1 Tax=Eumeta variegata TaxID=151549 RepID=A0A4C1ZKK5_EUMVA|nr:Probable RNA-directed DNA polymerase from transposon BS [Eumeta japonica]